MGILKRKSVAKQAISTSKDRNSSFEPVLISKHQTRISGLDNKIISFYAKGQTTNEVIETIKGIYDVTISSSLSLMTTLLGIIGSWVASTLQSI